MCPRTTTAVKNPRFATKSSSLRATTRHRISNNSFLNGVEVASPQDIDGHGTHVAGTAVGNWFFYGAGRANVGVAPGAYLMAYKALFTDAEAVPAALIRC